MLYNNIANKLLTIPFQCVSIYQDRDSRATALVDFCDTYDLTPQMV